MRREWMRDRGRSNNWTHDSYSSSHRLRVNGQYHRLDEKEESKRKRRQPRGYILMASNHWTSLPNLKRHKRCREKGYIEFIVLRNEGRPITSEQESGHGVEGSKTETSHQCCKYSKRVLNCRANWLIMTLRLKLASIFVHAKKACGVVCQKRNK